MRRDSESKNGYTEDGILLDDEAVWSLLGAYVDGEATPEEVERVEALFRSDPAYAHQVALIQRAGAVARSLHEIEPPPGLRQAIFEATIHRPTFVRRAAATWQRLCAVFGPTAARVTLAGGVVAIAGLAAALLFMPSQHHGLIVRKPGSDAQATAQLTPPVKPERTQPTTHETHSPVVVMNLPGTPGNRGITSVRLESGAHTGGTEAAATSKVPSALRAIRTSLAANRTHHGIPVSRQYVRNDSGQRPFTGSRIPVDSEYSVAPMMDQRYQRQAGSTSLASVHDMGVPGKDVVAADAPTEVAVATEMQPTASPAIPKLDSSMEAHVGVRIAHVSQLPPSTFTVPTTVLRRQMEARNLNFNTATMEGLQRREATLTLISTHF